MNLDLVNSIFNNLKENKFVQNFINELSNYLENNLDSNTKICNYDNKWNDLNLDEDLTLYAQWEKVTPSNIVYNANGADVDSESMPQNETKAKGEDYTISTKVPTRSGYEFCDFRI